ncbi:MAG TPA: tetratricopeptide repeat protein, partial [Candidatus Rifleibacterium sp.]|nr:tetratricopeptide repeat protein [Candidatus Rifleibacterium sp.]
MEFVKSGDYSSAAAFFATALGTAEPDKVQWRVILNSFYRAEAMADYEKYLRRYLETFSDDAAAWFNLGKMLYDRSELAQAAQAIVRGLRSEPDNVRGNFLLGSIYIDLKLFNESVTYLEKALALEPLNVECNRQLARALNASGKAFEARRYFQRILSLVPDDLEASQALAGGQPADTGNGDARVLIVQGKGEGRLVEKQAVAIPEAPVSGKVLFDASVGQTVPAAKVDQQVGNVPSPAPVQVAVAPTLQAEPKMVTPVPEPTPVPDKMPDEPSVVPGDLPRPAGVELYNRP